LTTERDHPIESTKEIAHTPRLINHFVVIITVLVYNFKLYAQPTLF